MAWFETTILPFEGNFLVSGSFRLLGLDVRSTVQSSDVHENPLPYTLMKLFTSRIPTLRLRNLLMAPLGVLICSVLVLSLRVSTRFCVIAESACSCGTSSAHVFPVHAHPVLVVMSVHLLGTGPSQNSRDA